MRWIRNWLDGHVQRVSQQPCVQMEMSNKRCLTSVPTGQILLNISIKDIDNKMEHICRWHQAEVQ